jgi:hypothetical protein
VVSRKQTLRINPSGITVRPDEFRLGVVSGNRIVSVPGVMRDEAVLEGL